LTHFPYNHEWNGIGSIEIVGEMQLVNKRGTFVGEAKQHNEKDNTIVKNNFIIK
jgi:hypothetical protein